MGYIGPPSRSRSFEVKILVKWIFLIIMKWIDGHLRSLDSILLSCMNHDARSNYPRFNLLSRMRDRIIVPRNRIHGECGHIINYKKSRLS